MSGGSGSDIVPAWSLALWALLIGVLLVFGTLYAENAANASYPWINHDVGYHTYLGKEMARGLHLYVDLKEDNPPGSPLLLAAVFVVGKQLGLPDFLAQHLFVLAVALLGLLILRASFERGRGDLIWALVALAYLIVAIRGNFSNSLYRMAPGLPYDFGQREHLFSLLFLPYLMFRLSGRNVPKRLYPYLLLLGGASTFKPFWPPMLALVELYCLRERRERWWLPPLMVGAGIALPFVLLLWHSTDSFVTFFVENIPTYVRGGYAHYDTGLGEFFISSLNLQMVGAWIVLIAGGTICLQRKLVRPDVVVLLGALAAVAYFSVIHQHKFWSYHAMVFFGVSIVPSGYLLASIARSLSSRRVRQGLVALSVLFCVGVSESTMRSTARMLRDFPPLGYELVRLIRPYPKTMFFSLSVVVTYAPLLLHKEMVGPWTVLLDLPELLHLEDPLERQAALDDYVRSLGATIDRERPELLVFSPERLALPEGESPHSILAALGLVPRPGYRRLSTSTLDSRAPGLRGWIVYERGGPIGPR